MCPVYRKEGKFKGVVRLEAYITEKASNSSHLNNEKRVWAFGDYKLQGNNQEIYGGTNRQRLFQ